MSMTTAPALYRGCFLLSQTGGSVKGKNLNISSMSVALHSCDRHTPQGIGSGFLLGGCSYTWRPIWFLVMLRTRTTITKLTWLSGRMAVLPKCTMKIQCDDVLIPSREALHHSGDIGGLCVSSYCKQQYSFTVVNKWGYGDFVCACLWTHPTTLGKHIPRRHLLWGIYMREK